MPMKKEVSDKEKLLGKPLTLGDLVGYQDGSIVSREVINKKTGTVTLFAFDEGEGLSTHSAPFDAMVYVVQGETEITIDDKINHGKDFVPTFVLLTQEE